MRQTKGITQHDLAQAAGLSVDHIGKIERGTTSPTVEALARIAGGLGVSVKSLLDCITTEIKMTLQLSASNGKNNSVPVRAEKRRDGIGTPSRLFHVPENQPEIENVTELLTGNYSKPVTPLGSRTARIWPRGDRLVRHPASPVQRLQPVDLTSGNAPQRSRMAVNAC